MSLSRSFSNRYASGFQPLGQGWFVEGLPQLTNNGTGATDAGGTGIATVRFGGNRIQAFRQTGTGGSSVLTPYHPGGEDTLVTGSGEVVHTGEGGVITRFHDFSAMLPSLQRGAFKSSTDRSGITITATYNAAGLPTVLAQSQVAGPITTTQQLVMAYDAVFPTQYANVKWQTVVNNAGSITTTTQRQVDYVYYTGAVGEFGEAGTLKRVTQRDGAGAIIDQYAYRYWRAGEANGYAGALKYVINPANYARIVALSLDPTTCTEAELTSNVGRYLADHYFEYDAAQRVTKEIANDAGSNPGTAGTFTYAYTHNTAATTDYNQWMIKCVETLPDGNQNIVYTNYASQVLLKIFKRTSDGAQWMTYSQYDAEGKETLRAEPSAVQSFDDTNVSLGVVLKASSGLIATTSYETMATTATATTPGTIIGQPNVEYVKQGSSGTPVPIKSKSYFRRADAAGAYRQLLASETVYRNDDGTGAQKTGYVYTWQGTTNLLASKVTTLPTIPTAQNGPNTVEARTAVYDALGREIWSKEADGGLTYREYDALTGALVKQIVDVDHLLTTDFTGLPSGWVKPTGGGLHLKTTRVVDVLGRTTKETDPEGNITYTVYNDAAHSVRTYPGWTGTTTTGPTVMVREDRAGSYRETLTMSATPAVAAGAPTGAEAVSGVQSLTRTFLDDGNRESKEERYIASITYAVTPTIGTLNTHYTRTSYGYDSRGRRSSVTNAVGTITQTEFDGLGRPTRTLIGTSVANVLPTEMLEYDDGLVGDGNLTKRTVPLSTAATSDRVTQYWYDWRNRLVADKQGVQSSAESTSTNRQYVHRTLDNQGNATSTQSFDADALLPTVVNGVPQPLAANLLRHRTDTLFDEQGRVYRRQLFSVDPSTGAVGATPLNTDFWYLRRAGAVVVKQASPGGLVTKYVRDFAGRITKESVCTTGNDTAWADAFNVSGESVLMQRTTTYNKVGKPLLIQTQDRFHDTTGTGDLGTATTGNKARVSYRTAYYDTANRITAEVDVGTNGAAAYTRPATVPTRSDTVLVTSYTYTLAGLPLNVTDPRGVITRTTYDLAGRKTRVIENYQSGVNSGNPSGSDINRRTDYAFTGIDQVAQITAVAPTGGLNQVTKYTYGVSSSQYGYTNDLLLSIAYPDKATGVASTLAADKETYGYFRNGMRRTMTDGNGTAHSYYYDMASRPIEDRVTALGAGVDGSVQDLITSYDSAGRPYRFTSYTASGGTIVNRVERTFNGFGQLLTEKQAPNGDIDAVGSGTQSISYAYAMPSGRNVSRLASVTYPNGRILRYEYGTASALDDKISRPVLLADDNAGVVGTTLEQYSYLGLGRIVKRAHPEPGIDLTRIKLAAEAVADAGDQYTALDRFGRVVDQRWLKTSDSSSVDRFQHAYDRTSNRLYQNNLVNPAWSELYHANGTAKDASFDKLNRMGEFRRGTLSASGLNGNGTLLDTVVTATDPNPAVDPVLGAQVLTLDQLGNWTSATEDGTATARTHNAQNQVTAVGVTAIGYDNNGNLTTQSPYAANVFDAWNRGVSLRGSTFRYDALGRRIMTGSATNGEFYYLNGDQVIETIPQGTSTKRREQVIWSLEYIDCAVLRDRDADGSAATGAFGKAASGLEERLYYLHDLRYSATALATHAGVIVERAVYDPYGGTAFFTGAGAVLTNTAYDNTITYTGRYRDTTGLIYFRARYFDPILGRFVSRDPLMFVDGVNLYCGYFAPNGMDPHGKFWIQVAGLVVGAAVGYHVNGFPGMMGGAATGLAVTLGVQPAMASAIGAGVTTFAKAVAEGQEVCSAKFALRVVVNTTTSYGIGRLTGGLTEHVTSRFSTTMFWEVMTKTTTTTYTSEWTQNVMEMYLYDWPNEMERNVNDIVEPRNLILREVSPLNGQERIERRGN